MQSSEGEEEAKDLPLPDVTNRSAVMTYCAWTPNGQIRRGPMSSASHIPTYPFNRYGTYPFNRYGAWSIANHIKSRMSQGVQHGTSHSDHYHPYSAISQ